MNWKTKLHGSEFKIMRLQDGAIANCPSILDTPEKCELYLRPLVVNSPRYSPDVESFGIIHLNTMRGVIGTEIISNGTLDTLLVHPREVFKSAIITNSSSIILFHNHPSGDPSPSEADIKVTRDLIRAGQLLKIDVLDHLILGQSTIERAKGYSSLRELGYFYN